MHMAAQVLNIVGLSDSGKTGVIVGLVGSLSSRGLRVATVKHHHHGELDTPGKDSWRHARAGAVATALVGESEYAIFKHTKVEPDLAEVMEHLGEPDIVLIEGFKHDAGPKIEVVRSARSRQPVNDIEDLCAIVTDIQGLGAGRIPEFGLDEHERLADFVEEAFLGGSRDR